MDKFEKISWMIVKCIMTSFRKMIAPYCEDCEYWDEEGSAWDKVGYCHQHDKDFCHNDFCSYGKRGKYAGKMS